VEGAAPVQPPLQDYMVTLYVGQGQVQKQLVFGLKLPNDLSAAATVAAFCGPRFPYVAGFSIHKGTDPSDPKALLCIGPLMQIAMTVGPELNRAVNQMIVPVGKAVIDHESFRRMLEEDPRRKA
jgi:hypothetical protein